jgi:ribosomal-protein-alanine N-acetyltransferase
VPELQRLRADHAPAVLAFELGNRVYFAASISDRGDEFYDRFTERHSALLAEQEAGIGAFHVLVAEDGSVLGRFNLVFAEDGTAKLGYRVAQHVAGRGVATATVRELCGLAAAQYGLRTLRAATSRENAASQKVLARAGFIPVGPADPADLGGKQGTWYQRDLVQPLSSSLLISVVSHAVRGAPPGTSTVTVHRAYPRSPEECDSCSWIVRRAPAAFAWLMAVRQKCPIAL